MKRIKQILESKLDKQAKINKLLQYDCELHTEIGKESTDQEQKKVASISDQIINEVIKLDPELTYSKESRAACN